MTPNAPTWGDVRDFVAADAWREISVRERSGSRRRHIFYEKVLEDGRVLQTHVSHSSQKSMSPGRFSSLLRNELEVSKDGFWECIRTGEPVDRPVRLYEPEVVEHDAWVVAVLAGELHLPPDEIQRLSRKEAEGLVYKHWARGRA